MLWPFGFSHADFCTESCIIFRHIIWWQTFGHGGERALWQLPDLFIFFTSSHNYFRSLGLAASGVWSWCVWDKVQEGVIVHCWIGCPLITLRVWSMEVKAIDYFNPPICESVILVALHSTGESLMGLSAGCLRPPCPINFQLEFARREIRGLGKTWCSFNSSVSSSSRFSNPFWLEWHPLCPLTKHFLFFPLLNNFVYKDDDDVPLILEQSKWNLKRDIENRLICGNICIFQYVLYILYMKLHIQYTAPGTCCGVLNDNLCRSFQFLDHSCIAIISLKEWVVEGSLFSR